MRILTTIIALWSMTTMAGLPPTTLSGEQATTKPTTFTFETPNYQSTQVSGIKSRIETGNSNLLVNPSFEHSIFNTSWTNNSGTVSADTTYKTDGKKGMKILSSSIGTDVYQLSTLNASNLTGLQMVAMADVNTVDPLTQLCAIVDSVDTNCTFVPVTTTSNPWRTVVIPFIAGTTNSGIRIKSATTTANLTTYIDNARVGQGLPLQNVNGAKLVGTLKYAPAANCQWSGSSSSYTDFAADTDCSTPTVTGSLVARGTKIPGFTINNAQAGIYKILATGFISRQTNAGECSYRFNDGTNSSPPGIVGGTASGAFIPMFESQIELSSVQSTWNVSLQYLSIGGTVGCYVEDDTTGEDLTFSVYYFPPESKIYSQASQDYAYTNAGTITIGATTTAPTKGTIVTDRVMASRKGQRLNAIYQYKQSSLGTTGSGTYLITLPSGLSFDTNIITPTTTSSYTASDKERALVGNGQLYYSSGQPYASCSLFAYDSTRFQASCITGATANTTNAYGWESTNLPFNAGTGFTFNLDAPISGWQDYGVIVGSFAGIEKCANDYECTDKFSAKVSSAAVVSNSNLNWISCSVAGTGLMDCTYNTNLKDGTNPLSSPMNCQANLDFSSSASQGASVTTSTSTGFRVTTVAGGSLATLGFNIECQKGANDYKPKTAKVATSIGIPTVPGITTSGTGNLIDTFSFSFGTTNATTACTASPCSYLDQIGNVVTSVTRSTTGTYTANFSKTYAKLKCSPVGSYGNGTGISIINGTRCENCSAFTFDIVNSAAALADRPATLVCQGSY